MTASRPAPILPLALILTVLFTAWWVALAWEPLAALRLPDGDDMVRLAQIRDWLGGQAFSDMTQARLGPLGGTVLHWSRLPDLAPGAVIWLLQPLIGEKRAELAAVIFWPELLFFLHLLLTGAIARRLGGERSAAPAVALAALAFPAIALFMPGRIDHHGLQIVLMEAMALSLIAGRLYLAGLAAAGSLLVGIETAPVILAATAWLAAAWVSYRRAVAGFALGWLTSALAGYVLLRPLLWASAQCDSFSPGLVALMLIAGGAWLALAGLAPRLPDTRWRAGTALAIFLLSAAVCWVAARSCFASPYGPVDPVLARLWSGQIGEMGGLPTQSPGTLIGWMIVPLLGAFAAFWGAWREAEDRWLLIAAIIGVSILAAFSQLRTLWFAAAFASPVLAHVILQIRGRGLQIAAGLACAGLVWQAIGAVAGGDEAEAAVARCTDAQTLRRLDRLDAGLIAGPLPFSAYALGATGHRVLAGPYHRNARGNRAMADLFAANPDQARYQAVLWEVGYIALCPDDHGGLPPALLKPGTLVNALLTGSPPTWLEPLELAGSELRLWRVRDVAVRDTQP